MEKSAKQVPFEQRKSQNLTFADYTKSTLIWVALPILGGIATFIGGRISRAHFNNKLWPLDGSPIITVSAWEKGISLLTKKTLGESIHIGEVERLDPFNRIVARKDRLNFTRDVWNFLKGTELAIFPTAFHFWRQGERTRLNLKPSHDRLQVLSAATPTNEDIADDNASLKKQLVYVDTQLQHAKDNPAKQLATDSISHEGKMESVALERV